MISMTLLAHTDRLRVWLWKSRASPVGCCSRSQPEQGENHTQAHCITLGTKRLILCSRMLDLWCTLRFCAFEGEATFDECDLRERDLCTAMYCRRRLAYDWDSPIWETHLTRFATSCFASVVTPSSPFLPSSPPPLLCSRTSTSLGNLHIHEVVCGSGCTTPWDGHDR